MVGAAALDPEVTVDGYILPTVVVGRRETRPWKIKATCRKVYDTVKASTTATKYRVDDTAKTGRALLDLVKRPE